MSHKRPGPILNILLLLVVTALVLCGAEVFLRMRASHAREAMRAELGEHELCTMASPDRRLIYTYKPNECGNNSQGYRDRERAFIKPKGIFRIVLIGDSVAEGRDVPPDSTFGRVLERMLNEEGDSLRYEVVLLARSGYSMSQELLLLQNEAFRYRPDLIVWSYCLNDPAHPVYHNANGNLGAYYYRPRFQLVALAKAAVFRAQRWQRGRHCPAEFHAFIQCAYWKETARDIERIGEIARENNVPVAFVVHPIFEDRPTFDGYVLSDVHARLYQAATSAGLIAVDVLDAFRYYDPHDLKVNNTRYFDPWHMNEAGHRLTAEYILSRIGPQH